MDLNPIVERLKIRLAGLRDLGAAADLEAALNGNRAAPAAYVIALSEKGQALAHTGAVDQIEHRLFGVILIVETYDPTGSAGVSELARWRARLKQALVGWVPEERTGEPVLFAGGQLVELQGNGRLVWSDEFFYQSYFRSTP